RGRTEQQIPDIREFARATEAPAYTEKEVQLVLSEQKTVRLEEKRSSIRYDASEIHINEDAREPITKKEVAAFNQLLVPYGKQTT
ncbi:anti-sigma factor, partial [human gut metagenome]